MDRQLFPIYLILGYIGFRLLMSVFYPVFVIIHELGHAIPARLTGKKQIHVVIGGSPFLISFCLFNIEFNIGSKNLRMGYTTYAKSQVESTTARCFIFATAPLLNLVLVFMGIWLWQSFAFNVLGYFILATAWLANVHIAFSSLWPFAHVPGNSNHTAPEGDNSGSDLFNLIQMLRENKRTD